MAEIPGSLQTQTREPLDGKYWVQTFNDLNTGLTFQGILRFSKTQDKLYIKLTDGWVELATVGSATNEFGLTIGTVTAGTVASVINVGTEIKPKLNFVLPLGRQGLAATINIERVEASPDGIARIQNVGTESDARLIFQLPKGVAGPKGDMFAINAQGTLANRAVYDGQAKDFVYLLDDSTSPDNGYIYLKTLTGWSNKIPFRGPQGATGNSTWIAYAQDATGLGATFIPAATTKYVSFLASVTQPVVGAFTVWQKYLGDAGTPGGPAGKSAYEIYVINGHPNATEPQFLLSLIGVNGTNGTSGASAYQSWLAVGNTGTEQQFIDSLKGSSSGYTLPTASTTVKGGIKIGTNLTVLNDIVSVDDSNSVHKTGLETIAGVKNFTDNIGVGTTTPTQKIDVVGNVKATAFIGDGSQLTNTRPANTDALTEGISNLYYTTARIKLNSVWQYIGELVNRNVSFGPFNTSNSLDANSQGNIFGNSCGENVLIGSYANTFDADCYTNRLTNTRYNQFAADCSNNVIGNSSEGNIFYLYGSANTLGQFCKGNIFGKSAQGNIVGDNCEDNNFGAGCVGVQLGAGCKRVTLINCNNFTGAFIVPANTVDALYRNNVLVTTGSSGGTAYTLPPASTTILGGVKIGANLAVSADGTVSAPSPGTSYTLPTASPTILGGIKVGTKLNIVGDVLSADNQVDSTISASTSLAPNSSSVSQALLAKADLVNGKVPIMQIPANKIMLKRTDGIFTYFSTYEEAINSTNPGETLYFGPGTFGSSTVNVHLQKTVSIVLDPNTTWYFQLLYLQTFPNTGDRTYVIDGQGGGKLIGTIKFNDGSQTVALTLTNLRHEGKVEHTSYLAGFNNSPAKIKFDQVRSIAATGDYLSVGMRNGGFYYKPLYIESYNSFHSVTAGSFINNLGSDGGVNAGEDTSLCRIYRSTIKCPSGTLLIVNADGAFVYDFSVVAYTGSLNAAIVNGTTYSFIGTPSGGTGGATGPTYTAGSGIAISGTNVISNTSSDTFSILPYAASIAIDFNAPSVRTLSADGNIAFAASVNAAVLKMKELFIINNTGASITLSFPVGWVFFAGPAPTTLAAGKQAILTLRALGTTDSTIKAAYVAQV